MAADKTARQLLEQIDKAVTGFQKGIPAIEAGVVETLLDLLKELDTQGGRLLNTVANLKRMLKIKYTLERLIINEGYKQDVQTFMEAFTVIESLHLEYFKQFNQKFTPSKTLPIIKELTVSKTLNDLIGQGLQNNIIDEVGDILQQNITSGGSYASLTKQLDQSIAGTKDQDGMLTRYTRTITTDAINQYSAQYHETIAADLNFDWGRYVGSNLTTTREFCELLTAKEWVHRSELPEIVKGHIDGHSCKLSKSTGLPLGMIPGTDASNFKVRRGGYNCGHQFFWTPSSAVPADIKARIPEAS